MSASSIPRPPGWHGKRYPYVWTREDRQRAVRLALTDAEDGLPLGIREAARRTGIPRSTVADWVQWDLKRLGLLDRWRQLYPQLLNRPGRR